jgi:putative tricarboxylic transport membrane protein
MRRALQISNGDISGLYNTWFSKTVYAIIVVLLVAPPVVRWFRSRRGAGQTPIAPQHANVEGQ